jgi:uncharacterized cupredoxin-like copper-binding protein
MTMADGCSRRAVRSKGKEPTMKPTPKILLVVPIILLSLTSAASAQDQEKKASAGTVEVKLTEYAIEMPETVPAGPTTFVVRNEGRKTHSFVLEGEGIEGKLESSLRPHATANLDLTLKPGKYKVYCPIGSHEAKGMTMTLVVTEKPAR